MSHSIPKGETLVNLYNICTQSVPKRVILSMVAAEAFNGSYKRNLFNFQNFDVGSITLVVNEKQIGGQPLTMDFDKTKAEGRAYVNAYDQMFIATGRGGQSFGNDIDNN